MNQPYTGTIALTNHGFTCAAWTAQNAHSDGHHNDALFPADGSAAGARNYCRNFNGEWRPYCATLHRFIDWDFCDLQICGGKKRVHKGEEILPFTFPK